jgi:hypothetical protein
LFSELYEEIEYDDVLDTRDAVRLTLDHDLQEMNKNISQLTL